MRVKEAIQLAEQFAKALNERDRDSWIACFHPDLEGYSGLAAIEGGAAYRGLEGAGAWFDNLLEVYESLEANLEQTIVVGDHALQLVKVAYVGKGSGISLAPTLVWVCEISEGRYVFAHSHFDIAEGFREMGSRLASRMPEDRSPGPA